MSELDTPATLEHRYAEVNGVRLHYVTAGQGPLMLFAHGFPEFWYAWHAQVAEFSRDHQAVAYDQRGYNLSGRSAELRSYSMRNIAEDCRQLIGALGQEKAIVVAHDWGGAMAWMLAALHPECIEKLVIVNAPHPVLFARELMRNPAQRAASAYITRLIEPQAEENLGANDHEWLVKAISQRSSREKRPDARTLALYREAWSQPGALTGGLNYYRASPLNPAAGETRYSVEQFPKVRVPTLVIWGEKDTALLPALLDGLDEHVTDLRIERIPEGTHWVVHEFPERVNALIRDFLQA